MALSILMLSSGIGLSHFQRLLLIAQQLQLQGCEVAFAYKDTDFLKRIGIKNYCVAEAVISDFNINIYAAFTPDLIRQCVEDELAAIRDFKPDAIVGDFRLTAAISAQIAQVPYISVVNGYMTDYFDPVTALATTDKQNKTASAVARMIQNRQKRDLAKNFRALAKQYRVKKLNSLYDFLTGDLNLIADIPAFCPLNKLPNNFHYIGPLIWEGIPEKTTYTLPSNLQKLLSSDNLIYATLGNTGDEKLAHLIVDAFKRASNYQVILTTGDFIDPRRIPGTSNIHIERFISGSAILPYARAAIHCGGNGSTYQALAHGVPALAIPFNNDQRINARLLRKNRGGMLLPADNLTGGQIKSAMERLIADPETQKGAKKFQQMLTNINGAEIATNAIAAFLNSRDTQVITP